MKSLCSYLFFSRNPVLLGLLVIGIFSLLTTQSMGGESEIKVAVASNFSGAMKSLVNQYEEKSGNPVILIFGSTGKHFSQIAHGAPFDLFFAADRERPELLEKRGLAVPGTRFTYATGKLVLWSPKGEFVDQQGQVLESHSFRHLSLANPRLAPYGKAAMEVLKAKKLWLPLAKKLVQGENIAQAFHFVNSGNAELGFVALSQLKDPSQTPGGSFWVVPQSSYKPIDQQAILLRESKVGRDFIKFVQSKEGKQIIKQFGYHVP